MKTKMDTKKMPSVPLPDKILLAGGRGVITKEEAERQMLEVDYTEIRDTEIRGTICRLLTHMLDNPDEHGIYPTSQFMWEMETYILVREAGLLP